LASNQQASQVGLHPGQVQREVHEEAQEEVRRLVPKAWVIRKTEVDRSRTAGLGHRQLLIHGKAQLAEEVTCVLTADDPNQPKNIASYSFKDKSFRPQPPLAHGQLAIHFQMVGSSLHIDSDEAKMQIAEENRKKEEIEERRRAAKTEGDEDAILATEGGKNQLKCLK